MLLIEEEIELFKADAGEVRGSRWITNTGNGSRNESGDSTLADDLICHVTKLTTPFWS